MKISSILSALLCLSLPLIAADNKEAKYANYVPTSGLSGTINVVGCDVFDGIFSEWSLNLQKYGITPKYAPEGSTAGVLALMEDQAQVASTSRDMTKSEMTEFGQTRPIRLIVGVDALVVFVHPSNPIKSISLEQLDAIYSTTRKQGAPGLITTWGQLGIKDPGWENRRISIYGRDEFSGPRASFRNRVLLKGEFRPGINIREDSAAVVEGVSLDNAAIGYASIADLNSLVKAVPIVSTSGNAVLPSTASITRGDYPLSNFLYMYVKPPISPLVQSFLSYVLSDEGQKAVGTGHIPLPVDVAKDMLKKIR